MVGAVMGLAGAWYSDRDRLDNIEHHVETHDKVHAKLHDFVEWRLKACMDALESGRSRGQDQITEMEYRIKRLENGEK